MSNQEKKGTLPTITFLPDIVVQLTSSGAKCDLSSPACRQCVRAGSKCDGYRDGNFLTFRDQTVETLGKIPIFPDNNPLLVSFPGNQGGSARSKPS
jgi:hypothetical protein